MIVKQPASGGKAALDEFVKIGLKTERGQILDLHSSARYFGPPTFDIDELCSIAKATDAAAENNMTCLRVFNDNLYHHLRHCKRTDF